MRQLKEIAGEYYLMHWVDGIFLSRSTPKRLIDKMAEILDEHTYKYKFEKIDNFDIVREDDIIRVSMTKNGIIKDFSFTDQNMVVLYNKIAARLNNDSFELYGNTTRDIQLPEGVSASDLKEWFL